MKFTFNMKLVRVIMALSVLLISSALQADIAVIVNPNSSVSSADMKEIKKVFLGKSNSISGAEVAVADQGEGGSTRNEFYKKVTKKNAAKLKSYWSKMIFSGKAVPPEVIGDDAAVLAWVAKNKNGIGYVDSGVVNDSVKVVLTVK